MELFWLQAVRGELTLGQSGTSCISKYYLLHDIDARGDKRGLKRKKYDKKRSAAVQQ